MNSCIIVCVSSCNKKSILKVVSFLLEKSFLEHYHNTWNVITVAFFFSNLNLIVFVIKYQYLMLLNASIYNYCEKNLRDLFYVWRKSLLQFADLLVEVRSGGDGLLKKKRRSISRLYCPVCGLWAFPLSLAIPHQSFFLPHPIRHLVRLVPLLFCFLLLPLIYFRLDSFNLSSHYLFTQHTIERS